MTCRVVRCSALALTILASTLCAQVAQAAPVSNFGMPVMLAQSGTQQSSGRGSSKGAIKLAILALVGAAAAGSWAFRKMKKTGCTQTPAETA